MKRVLLAGATGYLGGYVARELGRRGYPVRAVVRDASRLASKGIAIDEPLEAEVTRPETLGGCCDDIGAVISTVGITRQKDGLTYDDVDYRANLNLLREAERSGVQKFVYVSVLNGESLRHLEICDAKERFVERLEASGIDHCVIRPNGFFSDMSEYYRMAEKGRVYLFGDGRYRANPIHGEDLAEVCVDALEADAVNVPVGGPETLSQRDMALAAFAALGKPPKISCIPDWVRLAVLKGARTLTGPRVYGPLEFFLTVMAMDMIAPEYGRHRLGDYFASLADQPPR